MVWFRYSFSKGQRGCNDIKIVYISKFSQFRSRGGAIENQFFPKFKKVQIILGGEGVKKIMDFFHKLWYFLFWTVPLLIIITKQKKHQLEIHETAIKRVKYLFRGKFNVMSGQMTLKHQLLDNWHGQGVSHFKIHQYTIYIFKPRSFKAPSVWVSVSSKSQSPRLSISCIQLML